MLDLSSNKLSGSLGQGLATLTQIRELNLSSNRLNNIDGLSTLVSLETLEVSQNVIEDIREVIRLQRNANLRELALAGNPIA